MSGSSSPQASLHSGSRTAMPAPAVRSSFSAPFLLSVRSRSRSLGVSCSSHPCSSSAESSSRVREVAAARPQLY